jgi:hypothetical protein
LKCLLQSAVAVKCPEVGLPAAKVEGTALGGRCPDARASFRHETRDSWDSLFTAPLFGYSGAAAVRQV